LDREGEEAVIDDDKLWWDLFAGAGDRCYGIGNLAEEMTSSGHSHSKSPQSSTTQQPATSVPLEFMNQLQSLMKAFEEQKKELEEQKQQNQCIISMLESRGIQIPITMPRNAARTGESVSHVPPLPSHDVDQPEREDPASQHMQQPQHESPASQPMQQDEVVDEIAAK